MVRCSIVYRVPFHNDIENQGAYVVSIYTIGSSCLCLACELSCLSKVMNDGSVQGIDGGRERQNVSLLLLEPSEWVNFSLD